MTAGKRIFLNVVATYGRSLYALVVGLCCGRWALQALGEVDYGLVGLVGGLIGFVTLLNGLLSMSVMRFYAVSVGKANATENRDEGLEECRKWFNTAVLLHTAVPVLLVVVGYPIGAWAVEHFLTVPSERVVSCLWVWRFSCFACFVGMVTVPFSAMYTAKQEIAELTIYGFATTTLNAIVLYYMITHPAVWIVRYACWQCALSVLPSVIITGRAFFKYPECRFRIRYLWSIERLNAILLFAGARFWCQLTAMVASQGRAILVNKYLGPAFNAAVAVGGTVASQANTLSSSISGAFWPAIATAAGEGNFDKVKTLMYRTSRVSTMMVLVFLVPLFLETHEVYRLWLKTPPAYAADISIAVMIGIICSRMTEGFWMAIMGVGRRVGYYSFMIGWTEILGLAAGWILFAFGLGIWSYWMSTVVASLFVLLFRVFLGRQILGLSTRYWLRHVFLPVIGLTLVSLIAGLPVRLGFSASFGRIVLTTICCEVVFIPLAWKLMLDAQEKSIIFSKFRRVLLCAGIGG